MRRAVLSVLVVLGLTVSGPAAQQPPAPQAPAPAPAPTVGQTPAGQQPPPVVFKTEVNYVEVDAVVTDAQGTFVRKLTKDDFEVLEDGKPQKIELFSEIDIPTERPQRLLFMDKPVAPDTATNREPFNGRLYIIVLDDLHTAALRSTLVKRAAKMFIERNMGANDLAAVVTTSGQTKAAQEFTSNQALLLSAVDKFMGQKLRSRTLNRLDEYNRQRGVPQAEGQQQKILDSDDFQRGYNARNTLLTLRNLAGYLSGIHGRRKALLFFSEGIDYPIYDIFDSRDASTIVYETREALTAAAKSNVNFYTIDPQGLIGLPGDAIELTAPPEDPSLRLDTQGMQDEVRLAQDSLRTLAEETGGIALVNRNDFAKGFDQIVRANSTYYVLGYYPPDQKRDGRFHKITVRVKRPGLRITARKGYAAPKGPARKPDAKVDEQKTSPALSEALGSPLQRGGLVMSVQAAPFKGSAPNASVAMAIEMDGDRLAFKSSDKNLLTNKVELSFYPVNDQGKPLAGRRHVLDLALRPDTYEAVRAVGIRVNPRLDLPPGRYQIRIGARDSGEELGTVFYDLEVPDFSKEDLTMSGILLTAATARIVRTAMPDKDVEPVLPGPATSRRDFMKGDVLALFAEVYDNLPLLPTHKIDITTSLVTADGRNVFKSEEERSNAELKGAKGGGYGHAVQIPLKDVAPGKYLLRVEASARLKNIKPAARELLITVHPPPAATSTKQPGEGGKP